MPNIPIVIQLEDAPEKGDVMLRLVRANIPTTHVPVRNREPLWNINSVGGWNTTALMDEWFLEPTDLAFAELERESEGGRLFAPNAATAIARYHADPERCPFGEVVLHRQFRNKEDFCFMHPGGRSLFWFNRDRSSFHYLGIASLSQLEALHAFLGEAIAYQRAYAAGTQDSRIHRAIANSVRIEVPKAGPRVAEEPDEYNYSLTAEGVRYFLSMGQDRRTAQRREKDRRKS